MKTWTERKTLDSNGNPLAEKVLAYLGSEVDVKYCEWGPDDIEVEDISFPHKYESGWLLVQGDDSWGSMVNIWNEPEGDLMIEADFGDYGRYKINIHERKYLKICISKIL